MHELSFVVSMMDIVRQDARRRGFGSVTRIKLRIGALSCLCPDSVRFAFASLKTADELLGGCGLEIERVPPTLACRNCRARFARAKGEFACPRCGGRDLEVTEGMGAAVEWYEAEGDADEGENEGSPSGRTAGSKPAPG